MDYPGDQALDMYLMGKYDRAALRMGYGGVVDVWNTPGMTVTGSGDGQQQAYEAIGAHAIRRASSASARSRPPAPTTSTIHALHASTRSASVS